MDRLTESSEPKLLRVLQGEALWPPPLWLMRQAGRYLPEYREVRAQAGSFLNLCYTPDLAAEVTLQPIRRFGFDAAILFSDILVVPHALGQDVTFKEGEGPVLAPIRDMTGLKTLKVSGVQEFLTPVREAAQRVVQGLPKDVPLIGFAGAPWTVASYMVEGGGSRDFANAKAWAYRDPDGFQALLDVVIEATIVHLLGQIDAGARVVKLFDSWGGAWHGEHVVRWVEEPIRQVVQAIREARPHVPVIVFPRGVAWSYADFAGRVGAQGLAVDTVVPQDWIAQETPHDVALQGNLDPIAILAGGEAMRTAVERILEAWRGRPFIFNLGHGILPQTPPEHVAELMSLVRSWPSEPAAS